MNGVVHVQIQEGTLSKYGHIEETALAWLPVDNFKTKDTVEGQDYMKMSYYKRAIDLDDLKAPAEHVVTGTRLYITLISLPTLTATTNTFQLISIGIKVGYFDSEIKLDTAFSTALLAYLIIITVINRTKLIQFCYSKQIAGIS